MLNGIQLENRNSRFAGTLAPTFSAPVPAHFRDAMAQVGPYDHDARDARLKAYSAARIFRGHQD